MKTSYHTKESIDRINTWRLAVPDDQYINELTGDLYVGTRERKLLLKTLGPNQLSNKQDKLVSGQNIKTINNQSVLGVGNISILTYADGVTITGTGSATNPFVANLLAWVLSVTDDDNGVVSIDNTDTENPVINFNGVNVSGDITGDGTVGSPLTVAFGTITGTGLFIFMTGGDQTTTSTTVAAITDLVTPTLETNSRYLVYGHLHVGCNNTGGVKLAIDVPASSSLYINLFGRSSSITGALTQVLVTDATVHGTAFNTFNNANGMVIINGEFTTDITADVANLMFASGTAGQISTIYQEGSWFFIKKIA